MFRALGDLIQFFPSLLHHVDGGFHEVPHHGLHVAAHVADFGVLRCFNFYEGAAGEPREAPRNFRFSHAGGSDQQNIFWQDVFGQFGRQLLATHAVAHAGHGDGALRGTLPDN